MNLDLYAGGPSGWSTAMALLDPTQKPIGLEFDPQACATRAAIGHLTLRCDIGSYPLAPFFGKVTGVTASPPCQTFSASGKGEGRKHLERLVAQVLDADWSTEGLDDRTAHVLHTGRWVSTLMPEWVCFEQVRSVQPIWDAYAELLDGWGYSVWTGKLCAADYGTPQTRIRSILVASRVREVAMPQPTHAKDGAGGLAPWVSMAAALGRGLTQRPALTITAGGTNTGGADPFLTGGSASRRVYRDAQLQPGSWADGRGGNRRIYAPDEPAPALDTQGYKMKWSNSPDRPWPFDQPATTVAGDPRITARCHHDEGSQGRNAKSTAQVWAGDYDGTEPVKLEPWEALVLQDCDPDLPVQGTRTAQFKQIGNMIPCRLALAVLQVATGLELHAPDPADVRDDVAGAAPRPGPLPGVEAHVRAEVDRQGAEVDDRDEREGLAGLDTLVGAAAAGDVRGAEVGGREADPGAARDDGVVGAGGPGGVPVETVGSGGGEGDPPGSAPHGVDRSHDGPTRDLDPAKGGPAPAPASAPVAASTGSWNAPKAPRPVVHTITNFSVNRGMVEATVACGVAMEAKSRADLFENASAWYSLTTCPDCRARVEHVDADA